MTVATMKPLEGSSRKRYPIGGRQDVKNAVRAIGRTKPKKRAAVKRHIITQAKRVGAADVIPAKWKGKLALADDGSVMVPRRAALRLAARHGLDLAEFHTGVLELAMSGAKWKHGWIPINAIAAAIKAKQMHHAGGHGGAAPKLHAGKAGRGSKGKGRGSAGLAAARNLPSGGRSKVGKGKVPQAVQQAKIAELRKAVTTPSTPHKHMTMHELTQLKDKGSPTAAAEINRRQASSGTPAVAAGALTRMKKHELTAHAEKGTHEKQAVLAELHRREANRAAKFGGPAAHTAAPHTAAAVHAPPPVAAAPAGKPKRKPSALYMEYQQERQAQDRRFEGHVGGGIGHQDTHTQEYRDYFGTGDSRGKPVEQRVTYREFLKQRRGRNDEAALQGKSYDAGAKLGRAHGLRDPGKAGNAQYDAVAAKASHPDHFDQGYNDGVLAGAHEAHARQQKQAAASTRKGMLADMKARNARLSAGAHKANEGNRARRAAITEHKRAFPPSRKSEPSAENIANVKINHDAVAIRHGNERYLDRKRLVAVADAQHIDRATRVKAHRVLQAQAHASTALKTPEQLAAMKGRIDTAPGLSATERAALHRGIGQRQRELGKAARVQGPRGKSWPDIPKGTPVDIAMGPKGKPNGDYVMHGPTRHPEYAQLRHVSSGSTVDVHRDQLTPKVDTTSHASKTDGMTTTDHGHLSLPAGYRAVEQTSPRPHTEIHGPQGHLGNITHAGTPTHGGSVLHTYPAFMGGRHIGNFATKQDASDALRMPSNAKTHDPRYKQYTKITADVAAKEKAAKAGKA